MYYVVQLEQNVINNDSVETVDVWELNDFDDYDEAKESANDAIEKIINHELDEVSYISEKNDYVGINISIYNDDDTINNVETVGDCIPPKKWNRLCGECGAYCSGGTCFKYGDRVKYNNLGCERWHVL